MALLGLYIGFCIIGGIVGAFARKRQINISWSGKILSVLVILLLLVMGARLGANDEVMKALGQIGLSAFIITIGVLLGSLLMVFLLRKALGFNKKGERDD